MMDYSTLALWVIFLVMGIGTYLIRFSFLGLIGGRKLPDWLLRHLRYAPHAVLPAMVAPMVLAPATEGGSADPARLAAALLCALVGWRSKNVLYAILAGVGSFAALTAVLG